MKKIFILFSLAFGLFFVSTAKAQTVVAFEKGKSAKTMTITIPAKGTKAYSITVKKGQVINVEVSGDIGVSKSNDFPVISTNLTNGKDGIDNWQDGEGYLSVLAGRNAAYIISVANSDKKRGRTFTLKISVSNNKDDYQGGTE